TNNIEFSRYDISNNSDYKNFLGTIKSLQNKIPLNAQQNLLEHWEFIYERTLGCVGLLKDWFARSLIIALEEKCNS
ncbi:ATPase, partial [Bacillus sp. JJ664]